MSTDLKTCPWGQVKKEDPVCSFTTLMDEEFAKELQYKESNTNSLQKHQQGSMKNYIFW